MSTEPVLREGDFKHAPYTHAPNTCLQCDADRAAATHVSNCPCLRCEAKRLRQHAVAARDPYEADAETAATIREANISSGAVVQMAGAGPEADPWKHRSSGMRCKTCIWFVPKVADQAPNGVSEGRFGRCRRHAPTMNGFPAVFGNDWCGDHRLDENKL